LKLKLIYGWVKTSDTNFQEFVHSIPAF